MIELCAPGKLFAMGEYAVLRAEEPAVVFAVDREVRALVASAQEDRVEIGAWGLDLRGDALGSTEAGADTDPRAAFTRRLMSALRARRPGPGVHVVVEPHARDLLARDLGLGSSSALAVVLARAISPDRPATDPEILRLATAAHDEAQGAPGSGADLAVAWAGCSLAFRRGGDGAAIIQGLPAPRRWHGRFLWSGKSQRTGPAIRRYRSFEAARPQQVASFLRRSHRLCGRFIQGLAENPGAVASAVDGGARLMAWLAAQLGLEPPIPEVLAAAVVSGGGALRSSGALGGDCAYLVARAADRLPALEQMVQAAGYEILDLAPCWSGS